MLARTLLEPFTGLPYAKLDAHNHASVAGGAAHAVALIYEVRKAKARQAATCGGEVLAPLALRRQRARCTSAEAKLQCSAVGLPSLAAAERCAVKRGAVTAVRVSRVF